MNNEFPADRIEAILDQNTCSLFIRATGPDRSSLIASITRQLDEQQLYVASMVFSLQLPFASAPGNGSFPYRLEIEAKGPLESLGKVNESIRQGKFMTPHNKNETSSQMIDWFTSHYFHIFLLTPDRVGVTAALSRIVGRSRQNENDQCSTGNFVYLTAATLNDAGPHGGTPYFKLRANVAVESEKVMREILEELSRYAAEQGMENELKWVPLD